MATLQKPGKELYFEFNFPAAFKVLGKCIQLTLSNIFILSALIRRMGCIQLISFETQPGTSNCCHMGRKREKIAAMLRLIVLRGDEGRSSSETTRAAARSGHSPSLTQPDEPLGCVKAYLYICACGYVCVCVSQLKRMLSQNLNHKRATHNTLNWTTWQYIRTNSTWH